MSNSRWALSYSHLLLLSIAWNYSRSLCCCPPPPRRAIHTAASIKIALASTKTILHTRLAFDSRRTTQSSRNILSGELFEYLDRYCRRPHYWWSLLTRIYDAPWPGARLMRQSYVVLCRRSWIWAYKCIGACIDGTYSRGTRIVRFRRFKRCIFHWSIVSLGLWIVSSA